MKNENKNCYKFLRRSARCPKLEKNEKLKKGDKIDFKNTILQFEQTKQFQWFGNLSVLAT